MRNSGLPKENGDNDPSKHGKGDATFLYAVEPAPPRMFPSYFPEMVVHRSGG